MSTHGPQTLTREQARELDRRAIEEYGISSLVLMENAGRACADEALRMLGEQLPGPVLVLCGPGNNGGDGLVIARTLHNRGLEVACAYLGAADRLERLSGDFRKNLELWRGLGKALTIVPTSTEVDRLRPLIAAAALIVDALFGNGLDRPLGSPWVELIRLVNASGRPVLAVDLPSGIDANTGEVLGEALRADATVSFIAAKPGFYSGAGPRLCGRISVAEIGIPRHLLRAALGT